MWDVDGCRRMDGGVKGCRGLLMDVGVYRRMLMDVRGCLWM